MKTTIFYIGNFDLPDSNAAGKRVYGNALILEKLGYEVVVIGKHKEASSPIMPIQYSSNIKFYSFPNVSLLKTNEYMKFLVSIISSEGKPAIIIRYGSPGLAAFDKKVNFYCKKENIKVVADVVDWLPSAASSHIFNIIKSIDTFLEKAVFNKKSDGIIAISSYLDSYYKKAGCKTVIIPPVVHQYIENTTVNRVLRLIYAGVPFRIGRPVKNPSEVKDRLDLAVMAVIETAKRGANVVLEVYGITKEQYITAYPSHQSLLNCSEGSKAVIFLGRKDMKEVQERVNQADFSILLRDRNRATMAGFPTKIVESLSCGTPVITTDTSDIGKYVLQGVNGYIVEISTGSILIDQLVEIFNTGSENIITMKENCYRQQSFMISNFIDIMGRFISEIINNTGDYK